MPGHENGKSITMIAVGDVSPNRDDPSSIFRHCLDTFRSADIVFGQMEAPMSDRGKPAFVPSGTTKLPANTIKALTKDAAGFDVMSFATNHAVDYGEEAFFDTLDLLKQNNILVCGAGANIAEARKPAILERDGTRVGFLGYISILHPGLEAEEGFPGCAPLRASTFYWQWDYQPGTPPKIITQLVPEYRTAMEEDIRKLRPQVDVLVVSIHAGVHMAPIIVPDYQKEAGRAAIDAGADLVLQHHAHILKGIDVYRGKVIFYSLGNFALEHVKPAPGARPCGDPAFRRLRENFGIETVPGYEKHHFHHDALKTSVAKAYIRNKRIEKVTYLPAYITPDLEPEVLKRSDPRAQEVFRYMEAISRAEKLNVGFSWDGDEVLVSG